MACAADRKIDLTTCSICFETFKTPKCLPCLHSFCEGCLQTYITTTFGQEKGGVSCPICRIFVSKPDDVSVDEWSTKLPTHHILVSLIDINESEPSQKLCAACAREGETESACSWCRNCKEALCKTCDLSHRNNRATSNHKLVNIGENLSTNKPTDVLCTEHSEKKLETYCCNHAVLCCATCVMLKHIKCENVCPVEDAAEQKKQSKDVQEFENRLQDCKKSLEVLIQDRTENLRNFDTDICLMKKEMDSLFEELSDHLRKLKINILSEISKVEKEVRPEIEDERDEMKCRIPALEKDIDIFQNNMKHASPVHFLQAMEKLSEKKSILENYVKDQCGKLREIRVTFNANEKVMELSKVIQEFGRIFINRKGKDDLLGSADTNVDMITVEPKLTADVNTVFVVTGVALLENNQVVISNNNNNKLELRDPQCSSVLSSLPLPGHPWGVKMTSDTGGAVAVQGHGLVIFSLQNNQIVKISEIKTNVNFDFAYHRGKYFIRCNGKIAVYDSYHNKLRDISVNSKEGYIAVLDDTSLCYAEKKSDGSELHCMTMDGNQKFTYSHKELRHITGVTVDHAGYIYVCDYSSKTVHQLSHDGKLQRIMFKNLPASPYCISFNTRGNKAVIGCHGEILLYDLG